MTDRPENWVGEWPAGRFYREPITDDIDRFIARKNDRALKVAQAFHEAYERLAPVFGYKTREESAVPWNDVGAKNRALMIATAADLIERGVIT